MFGLLSGKIRRDAPQPTERPSGRARGALKVDWERLYRIVDVMLAIAGERGVTPAQVALNWVPASPAWIR